MHAIIVSDVEWVRCVQQDVSNLQEKCISEMCCPLKLFYRKSCIQHFTIMTEPGYSNRIWNIFDIQPFTQNNCYLDFLFQPIAKYNIILSRKNDINCRHTLFIKIIFEVF